MSPQALAIRADSASTSAGNDLGQSPTVWDSYFSRSVELSGAKPAKALLAERPAGIRIKRQEQRPGSEPTTVVVLGHSLRTTQCGCQGLPPRALYVMANAAAAQGFDHYVLRALGIESTSFDPRLVASQALTAVESSTGISLTFCAVAALSVLISEVDSPPASAVVNSDWDLLKVTTDGSIAEHFVRLDGSNGNQIGLASDEFESVRADTDQPRPWQMLARQFHERTHPTQRPETPLMSDPDDSSFI